MPRFLFSNFQTENRQLSKVIKFDCELLRFRRVDIQTGNFHTQKRVNANQVWVGSLERQVAEFYWHLYPDRCCQHKSIYSCNTGPLCNDHLDDTWEHNVPHRRSAMILDTVVGILTVSNLTSIEKQRHCERGSKSKGLYQSNNKKK